MDLGTNLDVLFVIGTRPEAIKMAPVVKSLRRLTSLRARVVVTGQHSDLVYDVLDSFEIKRDFDLAVMKEGQSLSSVAAKILQRLDEVAERLQPQLMIVHGDTTTTMAAAVVAYNRKIAVAHIEAGLRTGDLKSPWPEEGNRRLVASVADIHLAPTERAKANLVAEGIDGDSIEVTGNTVVDALLEMSNYLDQDVDLRRKLDRKFNLPSAGALVLVTAHRRENFGKGILNICEALLELGSKPNLSLIYPVHPNPNIREVVREKLADQPNITLTDPLNYSEFVYLMKRADVILTDSGGIQEEAPTFGKKVILMRSETERPEGIASSLTTLVGTNKERIVSAVLEELDIVGTKNRTLARVNPYGDGNASARIVRRLESYLIAHTG